MNLYNYAGLIEKFLSNEISAHEFEATFLQAFKDEKSPMSNSLFYTLDELFAWVDAFTDFPLEPELDPANYINENQLREYATKALIEITELELKGRLTPSALEKIINWLLKPYYALRWKWLAFVSIFKKPHI